MKLENKRLAELDARLAAIRSPSSTTRTHRRARQAAQQRDRPAGQIRRSQLTKGGSQNTCTMIEACLGAMGGLVLFDLQGWLTVVVGILLALITLFTSYSHVSIPGLGTITIDQQGGVLLLAALVPALLGDAQLATRRRLRAESDRIREQSDRVRAQKDRARAENEAARYREQAIRRAGRQARCDRIAFQHQLEPTAEHARQLSNVIALLAEYGDLN